MDVSSRGCYGRATSYRIHIFLFIWTAVIPSDIFDSLTRGAVPIFFMLSGALGSFRKDVPIVSVSTGSVHFRIDCLPSSSGPSYMSHLFADTSIPLLNQIAHYFDKAVWAPVVLLHRLLGLYLSVPYLGKILRASTETEIRIFLSLWFVVACLLHQARTLYPVTRAGTLLPIL